MEQKDPPTQPQKNPPSSSQPKKKEVTKFQVYSYFSHKDKMLQRILELTNKSIMEDYTHTKKLHVKEIKEDINSEGKLPENKLLHHSIIFSDYINHLVGRIANLRFKKLKLQTVYSKMTKFALSSLNKEARQQSKLKFDKICNYSKRKQEGVLNTGTFYDKSLCYYLMSKTFKKSSIDSFESFYRFDASKVLLENIHNKGLDINSGLEDLKLKIGSIGGGPGSDLTGTISFLDEFGIGSFEKLTVFDYAAENWAESSSKILNEVYKENYKERIKSEINWEFIDFNDPKSIPESIREYNVITVAWALNESPLVPEFWENLFSKTKNCVIIFIEGEDGKIVRLVDILEKKFENRVLIKEIFENPRRLIVLN